MRVLYTAESTATGGRNGQIKSENGVLDLYYDESCDHK
jgi:osmotically inducible protein OsmC